ncbi:MAG: ABC transporter permease [Bdellovibrionaceae bacterium]|nr:ABC transporter permease [Pseudobdellovibrionaceae bacterium]
MLLRALPGGPFDEESPLHPAVRERLQGSWDLQGHLFGQFFSYVGGLFRGDLGWSLVDAQRSVASVIAAGFRQTIWLNSLSLVFIFALGFFMALMAARRPHGWWGRSFETVSLAMVSLPSLFLGPLLVWLFAFHWDLLPAAFLDTPAHFVLPVLTLSLRPAASLARLLAVSLREAEATDYMRTARAKGLSAWHALTKHALRNSLMPVLGYAGPLIFDVLSGSFLVEVLFSVPGLGMAFVDAMGGRDYPVILGLTLFYGVCLVLISAGIDLLMKAADPRLREMP